MSRYNFEKKKKTFWKKMFIWRLIDPRRLKELIGSILLSLVVVTGGVCLCVGLDGSVRT